MKKSIEEKTVERLEIIKTVSFILTNEILFCVLYYLYDLNRAVSLFKLAKDLGGDRDLIADQLHVLMNHGFLVSESGKFRISETGQEAIHITQQAIGKNPYAYMPAAAAPDYSQVLIEFEEASSVDGSFELSLSVSLQDPFSVTRIETNRVKTEDKSAFAEESAMILAPNDSEAAQTNATSIQYNL